MNRLRATVSKTTFHDGLIHVDLNAGGCALAVIVIKSRESNDDFQTGQAVTLLFKETEVLLMKLTANRTTFNQLPCRITDVIPGTLLTRILLDFQDQKLSALALTRTWEEMSLYRGDDVMAVVSASEISIAS